jgi:hypothetical protein
MAEQVRSFMNIVIEDIPPAIDEHLRSRVFTIEFEQDNPSVVNMYREEPGSFAFVVTFTDAHSRRQFYTEYLQPQRDAASRAALEGFLPADTIDRIVEKSHVLSHVSQANDYHAGLHPRDRLWF